MSYPTYPHDGLGGPQHYPEIIHALSFRDCIEERCGHTDECPTHEVPTCGRCTTGAPELGEVAFSAEWPCQFAGETA